MKASVRYDPHATCPLWDAFLEQVQPEEAMREYLYRIWGYSLTADYSEQAVFLNHGGGANGKIGRHGRAVHDRRGLRPGGPGRDAADQQEQAGPDPERRGPDGRARGS